MAQLVGVLFPLLRFTLIWCQNSSSQPPQDKTTIRTIVLTSTAKEGQKEWKTWDLVTVDIKTYGPTNTGRPNRGSVDRNNLHWVDTVIGYDRGWQGATSIFNRPLSIKTEMMVSELTEDKTEKDSYTCRFWTLANLDSNSSSSLARILRSWAI